MQFLVANSTRTSGRAGLEKTDSPTMALVSPDEIVAMINLPRPRAGQSATIHSDLSFALRTSLQMDKVQVRAGQVTVYS
jgi:hypothetical protein